MAGKYVADEVVVPLHQIDSLGEGLRLVSKSASLRREVPKERRKIKR